MIVVIKVSESLSRYMIQKGSVAVDGISLTINQCSAGSFEVSIIPHTAGLTTIGFKAAGAAVNIETDMIGKYVERFLMPNHQPRTLETASRSGYAVSGQIRVFIIMTSTTLTRLDSRFTIG